MLKLFMAALYLLISGGASLAQEATPAAKTTPADGHTIHVTAPHLIDGKVRGPFHHYCKVVAPDPIVAKTLTRDEKVVPPAVWKRVWHDHETEIATGNVKVLDLPPDKAKEVADTVAKTDGIIFSLWPEGAKLPTGRVSMGQMVGHTVHPAASKKE